MYLFLFYSSLIEKSQIPFFIDDALAEGSKQLTQLTLTNWRLTNICVGYTNICRDLGVFCLCVVCLL